MTGGWLLYQPRRFISSLYPFLLFFLVLFSEYIPIFSLLYDTFFRYFLTLYHFSHLVFFLTSVEQLCFKILHQQAHRSID
jgi:hypothetical protein